MPQGNQGQQRIWFNPLALFVVIDISSRSLNYEAKLETLALLFI
jgi:hypothetical protein